MIFLNFKPAQCFYELARFAIEFIAALFVKWPLKTKYWQKETKNKIHYNKSRLIAAIKDIWYKEISTKAWKIHFMLG